MFLTKKNKKFIAKRPNMLLNQYTNFMKQQLKAQTYASMNTLANPQINAQSSDVSTTSTSIANDPYSTTSTFTRDPNLMGENLSCEEKKALANVGFKFNKKTSKWELTMKVSVELPSMDGILAYSSGQPSKAVDQALEAFRELKNKIVAKLTAKIVFMELIKPRKIKE